MVEAARRLDIGAETELRPWSTLFDVAAVLDRDAWVLVGGLMVEMHTRAAGVSRERATTDVDVILDIAPGPASAPTVGARLREVGFVIDDQYSPRFVHRFRRGSGADTDIVDIMVPNPRRARLNRLPLLSVEAGEQAITRRQWWEVAGAGRDATVGVPSVLGALVAKAVALRVDQRNPARHAQDALALYASATIADLREFTGISTKDRRRLRVLHENLAERHLPQASEISPLVGFRAPGTRPHGTARTTRRV